MARIDKWSWREAESKFEVCIANCIQMGAIEIYAWQY